MEPSRSCLTHLPGDRGALVAEAEALVPGIEPMAGSGGGEDAEASEGVAGGGAADLSGAPSTLGEASAAVSRGQAVGSGSDVTDSA